MKKLKIAALAAAALSLLFAGCAPQTTPAATTAPEATTAAPAIPDGADPTLYAMVPQALRDSGVLKVAVSLAYEPMEFSDPGSEELKGIDIELAQEVGKRLGLTVEFDNVDFEQLITGVTTGRDDLIWTAMSDYTERQTKVDFVDYFRTGDAFFAPAAAKDTIKDTKDLCGLTVTVASGTNWGQTVKQVSDEVCTDGKEIGILEIETLAEQKVQMKTDRAQAILMGLEGGAGADLEAGEYYHFGEVLKPNNYGVGVAKENTGLRDAVQAALKAMGADGTYLAILTKYGCADAAIADFTINDGISGE
ncbi:MAG: transporter substrate-binding domain-containing protein [Propionibacteriaceae bacterium]|jgi:polar amino acid transport system substrate-binding protein|nr:transporter substrate-binding domain-containing protein [Propionibacteriaceae bacterium]